MKTQVVPIEPTKEMLDAFDVQDSLHYNPANKSEQYKARHTWKTMLEAAPIQQPTDSKEHKKLKKDSLQFVGNVYQFINWLDAEMKAPSNLERDKRIAKAVNGLEMAADQFSHFTLSQSFEQIAKIKRKEK